MAKVVGPRKDLGVRYACFSCGTKFYDLHRPTPTCPKCGADQREDPALKAPKPTPAPRRAPARPKRPPRKAVVDEDEDSGASRNRSEFDDDFDSDDSDDSDDLGDDADGDDLDDEDLG